jgi:hypothetical protein
MTLKKRSSKEIAAERLAMATPLTAVELFCNLIPGSNARLPDVATGFTVLSAVGYWPPNHRVR